ncbi:hypothetical protein [Nonomuraea sp. KM90]|uniref:hypothetical protein n=1 Tax=Nonomuraea sp. KM90 TaxID=3457428 RepID=UPI003FCC40C0
MVNRADGGMPEASSVVSPMHSMVRSSAEPAQASRGRWPTKPATPCHSPSRGTWPGRGVFGQKARRPPRSMSAGSRVTITTIVITMPTAAAAPIERSACVSATTRQPTPPATVSAEATTVRMPPDSASFSAAPGSAVTRSRSRKRATSRSA